jgi:hypothetical protein
VGEEAREGVGNLGLWGCFPRFGPVWIAGLELELVSNSSSSPKLTLTLKVFG